MLHQLVLLLMAPVLLPQGISMRKSTPRLKEAAGPSKMSPTLKSKH